jgi:O-antigen ligase
MSNILVGLLVYTLVKKLVSKEQVGFFIKVMLWLCVANLAMIILQLTGYDFIYKLLVDGQPTNGNHEPAGLMGLKAMMGVLMACCVPLALTRRQIAIKILGILLFIPIFMSQSFIAIIAGMVGSLFVLYQKRKKMTMILSVGLLVACMVGGFVINAKWKEKVDSSIGKRAQQWKESLSDCMKFPITGYGLDSFRNVNSKKEFVYVTVSDDKKADTWDNPHNIIISLFFEWGLLGLIFFVGYIRKAVIDFNKSLKEPNTIALAGFAIVVLITSMVQFPLWFARTACFIVPMLALMETQFKKGVTT